MDNVRYENVSDLEITGSLKGRISLRPITQILMRGVIGICLLLLRTKYSMIGGAFFLLLAAAGFLLIKDRPVMDFYDDVVVIYNAKDSSEAFKLPFEQLKLWSVDASDSKVFFTLYDDTVIGVSSSRYLRVYNMLVKLVPEKCEPSTMEKIRERMKRVSK